MGVCICHLDELPELVDKDLASLTGVIKNVDGFLYAFC